MATPIHGKKGSITYAGCTMGTCRSWSMDTTTDVADISHFGDEWRDYIPGMGSWTVSAECLFAADDAGLDEIKGDVYAATVGTKVALVLTADSGATYTGSGIVTSCNHNTSIDDAQSFSVSIQGCKQPTATW